jgi:hypothetical protein
MNQKQNASADSLAVMANLRDRDTEFCRRLLLAIEHGDERCPTSVNTKPGTRRPIFGYRLD